MNEKPTGKTVSRECGSLPRRFRHHSGFHCWGGSMPRRAAQRVPASLVRRALGPHREGAL